MPAHGSGDQKPGLAQAGFSAQGLTGLRLKCLIWSFRSSSEPIQIVAEFSSLHLYDWGSLFPCWLSAPSMCLHSLPPGLLHLQSQQQRLSLASNPFQASNNLCSLLRACLNRLGPPKIISLSQSHLCHLTGPWPGAYSQVPPPSRRGHWGHHKVCLPHLVSSF